jgi:hypothetical protein
MGALSGHPFHFFLLPIQGFSISYSTQIRTTGGKIDVELDREHIERVNHND